MQKIQFFIITKSIGLYLNLLSYINVDNAKSKAYRLFTSPRKGKLNAEALPKILQSATRETIEYGNEKIQAYIWKGTSRGASDVGPAKQTGFREANDEVILLVHGWESNASRWKKLLHHLIPLGKTIIALDGPAHGLSGGTEFSTPKYAEFINVIAQRFEPKILIGHSAGGAAISFYLNKYKNPAIEKVILLGAPSDFKIVSNNFVKLLSLNDRVRLKLEDYFIQRFQIGLDDFSGHKFAQNFSQKALIAHDLQDNVVLVDEGRKYANTWKNAVYIETTGLGHSMHDAELYKKIAEFL
ncbi:alpha/beta hydrolase [Flavobacterium sp.]